MALVCPSCDATPPQEATLCPACGAQLVRVSGDDDAMIGQVLDGRFEIVARLGQGGMGTVYRAKQRSIGREVALKLIDRRFEHDVTAVKRFLREAKLASQLSHPNTVTVVDFGQCEDGRLYLAMELVRGRTLHEELARRGPFALARLARHATQIVDALETAHAMGIVHRDLKLENVMVLDAPGDLVKLLDFGLARSFVDPGSRATGSGQFSGTPRYLAPEVIEGAEPAPAQDLYALGVMLVELASGRSPFDGPTLEMMFSNKVAGKPQLDGLDPALGRLVERMLAVRPGDRPTHAEIRAALGGLTGGAQARPARGLELASTAELVAPAGPPAIELSPVSEPAVAAPPPRSEAFVAPSADKQPLELETEWVKEKAVKQTTATMAEPPRRARSRAWIFAVIGVLVAGVIAAGVIVQLRSKHADNYGTLPATEGTIGIQIRADPRAMIRIDGNKAGFTPLTVHMKKSTRQVRIDADQAGHIQTKLIVPDQDQDVAFTR